MPSAASIVLTIAVVVGVIAVVLSPPAKNSVADLVIRAFMRRSPRQKKQRERERRRQEAKIARKSRARYRG